MKTARYVGLLAVVTVIVFGITFAMSYLPAMRGGGPKKSASRAILTFADSETRYPPAEPGVAALPAEVEYGTASHDFWFQNNNPQDLPVGLFEKSCQCTSVELLVAPKEWKNVPEPAKRAEAAETIAASAPRTDVREKDNAVVVPAGAVGLVRLTWKSSPEHDRQGPKSLTARLWMGEIGSGPTQQFDINTIIVPAVRAAASENVGPFALGDLPQTVYVRCYSSTRTAFPLEVNPLLNRGKEGSSPFEVGTPEPLNPEELAKLLAELQSNKQPVRAVLSGYRIPIKLLKVAKDKTTPMDAGPFRLRLELKTEGDEPVETSITGLTRGDLSPLGGQLGVVDFGPFDSGARTSQLIQVESGADVKGLELDHARTADFLTVVGVDASKTGDFLPIKVDPQLVGGRLVWNLEVQWVPGSPSGVLPPGTAVYVRPVYAKKADGPPPACLRTPRHGEGEHAVAGSLRSPGPVAQASACAGGTS